MDAGRELDAQVHADVYNHLVEWRLCYEDSESGEWYEWGPVSKETRKTKLHLEIHPCYWESALEDGTTPGWFVVPWYSTDIAEAWPILKQHHWLLSYPLVPDNDQETWKVYAHAGDVVTGHPIATASTAPHAICLEALKTAGKS